MRRIALFLGCSLITGCTAYLGQSVEREFTAPPQKEQTIENVAEINPATTPEGEPARETSKSEKELPKSVMIAVPFTSQAPHANWDMPYQEACEEASVIMVHHYLNESTIDSPEQADREILELVSFEQSRGYAPDVTMEELADIVQAQYGHDVLLEYEVTVERMKQILAEGYPIIIPVAGRRIGNPYFSGEGPFYHMLVVRGYDRSGFFTNDPGTRRGEEYHYPFDTLINAIHNWTGVKEEIERGEKVMMILK